MLSRIYLDLPITILRGDKEVRRMRIQCCMCRKFRQRRRWIRVAGLSLAMTSYTYCPECYATQRRVLARERARNEYHIDGAVLRWQPSL